MSTEQPMTYTEAVALANEIGESLGGRSKRALEVLVRFAERGRRPSSMRQAAVGGAMLGVQHFSKATSDLQRVADEVAGIAQNLGAGMVAIATTTRSLRELEDEEQGRSSDDELER